MTLIEFAAVLVPFNDSQKSRNHRRNPLVVLAPVSPAAAADAPPIPPSMPDRDVFAMVWFAFGADEFAVDCVEFVCADPPAALG